MKVRALVLCLLVPLVGCNAYDPLILKHEIQAGTVIRDEDLRTKGKAWVWTVTKQDYALDRSKVVGHKAKRQLRGAYFHMSDIE